MPLTQYQKTHLVGIRAEERIYGVTLVTMTTGAGYVGTDAYRRRQQWIEQESYFSGAIAWTSRISRTPTEGGWYPKSDLTLTCSRDYLDDLGTGAGFQEQYNFIKVDGIKFQPTRIADCPDTEEIVVFCDRIA